MAENTLGRLTGIEDEMKKLKQVCLDLQCRSMKYNLIFTNIIEVVRRSDLKSERRRRPTDKKFYVRHDVDR